MANQSIKERSDQLQLRVATTEKVSSGQIPGQASVPKWFTSGTRLVHEWHVMHEMASTSFRYAEKELS